MINTHLPKDLSNRVIDMPLAELRIVARKVGVKQPWRYRKGEMVTLVLGAEEQKLRRAVQISGWDRTYEAKRAWIWLGTGIFIVLLVLAGVLLVL